MGTYKLVVDAIRDAANTVNPTGQFTNGRKIDTSLTSISTNFPLINLYPFKTPRDQSDNDASTILIGFWMQDSTASSMLEREDLIDQMDDLSDAFYTELLESNVIQITNFVKEPQYQHYSGTLSGYAVSFTLISKSPC